MNRTTQSRKLGWIFEKDDETGEFKRFNYMERVSDRFKQFRIPEHQRFPNWSKDKKKCLINSILRNYPIHSIICSKHHEIIDNRVKEYYDIEDGQTRLSILQEYYDGGFKDENGHYFSDLPPSSQRYFENYEVNIEIIEVEDENVIHEIFDRLQMGQPLRDCDKFWNWKAQPLVNYALELIGTRNLDKYMGTQKFSSQKRERLSDVVGLLALIIYWDVTTYEYINNSFKSHFKHIKKELDGHDKEKVENFLEYYFSIIDSCYEIYPKQTNEKNKKYYNICADLGLILYDYFENGHNPIQDRKDMWVNYFLMSRKNKNLTIGKKHLWNNVTGKPNWTQPKYVACRVDRVYEFYDKIQNGGLDEFCENNNIELDSTEEEISSDDEDDTE
jgi:hypothetical protein